MKYISTRQDDVPVSFNETLRRPAVAGGLWMPESWPHLAADAIKALHGKPFAAVAGRILAPFILDAATDDRVLATIIDEAFGARHGAFGHEKSAPLVPLGPGHFLLELFHGPTLSAADFSARFLGATYHHLLSEDAAPVFVAAVNGDEGPALLHALTQLPRARLIFLHAQEGVSNIQRRQMTTGGTPRIYNLAVEGHFDDCQKLAGQIAADPDLAAGGEIIPLGPAGFIDLAVRAALYFYAVLQLPPDSPPPIFVVPEGDLSWSFAGSIAQKMGLNIGGIIAANGVNDPLYRFFASGELAVDTVKQSVALPLDLQIPYHFERALFEVWNQDRARVGKSMLAFSQFGYFTARSADLARLRGLFRSAQADDDAVLHEIKTTHQETGRILDPVTAVAAHAARAYRAGHADAGPLITLGLSHPGKFAGALAEALEQDVPLPPSLAALTGPPEHFTPVANNFNIVKNYVRGIIGA